MTSLIAQAAAPAGGSPVGQVLIASLAAAIALTVLLAIGRRRRSGRSFALLDLGERTAERTTGLPGWASLPVGVCTVSLITAVFGLYWDVSLHMGNGRDAGPLANPSHYFILGGLLGIFAAGWLACVLPGKATPGPAAVRISADWHVPVGGLVMMACAAFAASGFPLDDVWHRLFGQDVTLWGPTHMMMLTGAAFTLIGIMILMAEGKAAASGEPLRSPFASQRVRWILASGGVLIGLSIYQGEFDFGAPQFRLLYHPVLLMLAASIALVTARIWIGRGGALMALFGFLVIRGLLTGLVGGVWGQTTPHFPLYAVEAISVEVVALLLSTRKPVLFGAVSGAAIGTFGLAAEWGWSHVWMTMSWPSSLLPEGVIFGFLAAVSGGVIGAAIGRALAPPVEDLAPTPRWAVIAAGIGLIVAVAVPLPISAPVNVRAQVTLTDVTGPPKRTVNAEVKLSPPDAADDAEWFKSTAWQGGGSVVADMRQVSPGVYRSTKPIPVYGNWKATLRLHKGRVVAGLPVFLPEDPAIPAKETPAEPQMTREFVLDKKNLQREQKQGVPGYLTTAAYLVVLMIVIGIVAALTIGLLRMDRDRSRTGSRAATAA